MRLVREWMLTAVQAPEDRQQDKYVQKDPYFRSHKHFEGEGERVKD